MGNITTKVHGEPIRIGGFSPDREIYVKFRPKGPIRDKSSKVPIQIQLEYLDEQGNKKMRSIHQNLKIVTQEDEFQKQYNPKIATSYELSKASQIRSEGNVQEARKLSGAIKARNLQLEKQYGMQLNELNALVADEEEEWEREDKEMEAQQVADKGSYYASGGQKRFRSSLDVKMARMKKKQKQKNKKDLKE
jgi:hypothetical protein